MTDRLTILNEPSPDPAGLEALRERAASALEGALGFVEREGNDLSCLRAQILVELEPIERGLEYLQARQASDGRFEALGQVMPASVEKIAGKGDLFGTLEGLSVLADWGRLYEGVADRAVDALFTAQASDGHFASAEQDSDPDGSLGRVVTTALLAGFLGRSRSARPEMLRGAGTFLAEHWSVDFIRQHGWPAVAAFAHYFTNVYDEEREAALPWCARELERGMLAHEYGAGDVMRVLFYCEASALPGVAFDANALLARLFEDQQEDGSFAATESIAGAPARDRVSATLDAMLFTLRVCRSAGQ